MISYATMQAMSTTLSFQQDTLGTDSFYGLCPSVTWVRGKYYDWQVWPYNRVKSQSRDGAMEDFQ